MQVGPGRGVGESPWGWWPSVGWRQQEGGLAAVETEILAFCGQSTSHSQNPSTLPSCNPAAGPRRLLEGLAMVGGGSQLIKSTVRFHHLDRAPSLFGFDFRDLVDEAKDYHLMPERRPHLPAFKTRPRCCTSIAGLIYAVGGLNSAGTLHIRSPQRRLLGGMVGSRTS